MSNSGTLTADEPIFGAGTTVIKAGTKRGNTDVMQCADTTVAPTTGHLAAFDANGNITDGGAPAGATPTPVENEVITGVTGTTLTLANTPSVVAGYTQVKMYRNVGRMQPGAGNDFTWSGATVTINPAAVTTDVFIFDYWK